MFPPPKIFTLNINVAFIVFVAIQIIMRKNMKHREKKRNDDEAMMAMMVKSSTQANDKVPAKCQSE